MCLLVALFASAFFVTSCACVAYVQRHVHANVCAHEHVQACVYVFVYIRMAQLRSHRPQSLPQNVVFDPRNRLLAPPFYGDGEGILRCACQCSWRVLNLGALTTAQHLLARVALMLMQAIGSGYRSSTENHTWHQVLAG